MTIRVEDLALARVLVVGDVVLDRYWYGSSDRISPEAQVSKAGPGVSTLATMPVATGRFSAGSLP